MIVVSCALVVIAAVLLVFGIIWSMPLIYAAIVLSIVSAFLLLISSFQRPAKDSGLNPAEVFVVSGRPSYHVDGCSLVEYPAAAELLDRDEALELGFTPCGECRPDQILVTG